MKRTRLLPSIIAVLSFAIQSALAGAASWETIEAQGTCAIHEECGIAAFDNKVFVLGGRKNPPVDVFDPFSKAWTTRSNAPFQMHHFQAVVLEDKIAVIGGFTGNYPKEDPIPNVWYYYPDRDKWEEGPEIPQARRRGAAGAILVGDHVYLVGGIVNGHWDGYVPWLDRWNWKTGEWTILPDAPHARDHFQAALLDGHIMAAGGRTSSAKTKQTFHLTVSQVDAYNLETGEWKTLPRDLPTPRAGTMAISDDTHLLIVGGESFPKKEAHDEVEVFSFETNEWAAGTPLKQGRHGTGICRIGDALFVAAGNGNRGGGNKLQDIETISWKDVLPE